MRRVRFPASIAAVIGLLLCFVSTALGEIPLYLSFVRQVPADIHVGSFEQGENQVLIEDVDGDRCRDLLFNNSSSLAIYSVRGDSTIFNFDKDGGHTAVGYLDNDDFWDIVNCRIVADSPNFSIEAVAHLSTDGWEPSDTIVIESDTSSYEQTIGMVSMHEAMGGGLPELYVYYFHTIVHYEPPGGGGDYTWTEIIHHNRKYSFADSTTTVVDYSPPRSFESYDLYPGESPVSLLIQPWQSQQEEFNHVRRSRSGAGVSIFQAAQRVGLLWFSTPEWCNCFTDCWLWSSAAIRGHLVGEFRADSPGPEILFAVDRSASVFDQFIDCDTTARQYGWYDLARGSLFDSIDVVTIDTSRHCQGLAASSNYPGLILSIENRRLLTLNPLTFAAIDSSGLIDSAIGTSMNDFIALDRLGDDGPEYLIVRHGPNFYFLTFEQATDVDTTDTEPGQPLLPTTFAVGSPYPNPFNPSVTIPLALPAPARVTATVFNVIGQAVDVVDAGTVSAGNTELTWDASRHPSGVYFIRVATEQNSKTVKAVLLK